MTTTSTTSSAPLQQHCQVVLSLAHLLHQQSPHYDIEKNALLAATAQCALQVARRAHQQQQQPQPQGNSNEASGDSGGEVHLFLTGSPRPTFAETNAWLLESYRNNQSPAKNKPQRNNKNDNDRRCDKNDAAAADENDNISNNNKSNNNNNTWGKKKVEKVNDDDNDEPLVGHAVVNAISQTSGVGLKCIRSKMLQGTIDRPEWDQTRWTDGECLFSELIGLVGLESFEGGSGAGSGTSIVRGKKATNLSANLITVSVSSASSISGTSGMGEETFEEIARNVLRCLRRRKNSSPASVIHLIVPPDELIDEDHNNGGRSSSASSSKMTSSRLMEAFDKLEKYNDMIGVPRLMANARLEVVHVSTFAS